MSNGTDIDDTDVPGLLRAWCAIYEGDPEFAKRTPAEQSSIRFTLYIGSMAALEKAGALAWPIPTEHVSTPVHSSLSTNPEGKVND